MPLSAAQMGRMSRLLDEALRLDEPGRRRWLEALAPEDRDLEEALRHSLLAQQVDLSEALLTLPRIIVGGTTAPRLNALKPGDRVGPYELVRELGSGGMAEVWLAQRADGAFKREVALKLPMLSPLRKDLASRFERERDILAGLEHPNIARLYDAGVSAEGLPYLAMEYVHGEPLIAWCNIHRTAVRERLKLFLQVLDAVQYAHGQHVIHRDIKPSNILVTDSGQARLLDFGVAKLLAQDDEHTELTQLYGRALTPEYASPELVRGESIGVAADVYSLGVVLYELLAGSRPYRLKGGISMALLEQAIATAQVEPASTHLGPEAGVQRSTTQQQLARRLRGDLDAILLKALTKAPEDRYASAAALADDVQRYLSGDPIEARPAGLSYRSGKYVQRHRTGVATAAAATALVAAGIGYELMRPPRGDAASAPTPGVSATPAAVSEQSIAVLPFVDMSEKHDQEYFSDGLAEELIDVLAKVPQLHVIARTSSFSFKGKPDDIPTIARKLSVANILEGSVRKAGSRLRVTTQLVRADNGEHVWSETYDRQVKDVFQIQDEIAAAVVGALKVRLLRSQQPSSSHRAESTEAYNYYLLGRAFANRRTVADQQRALQAYRRAVELDPRFAPAYAGLSMAQFEVADNTGNRAGYERAMAWAEKAVALAPEQADGYAMRGYLRNVNWDWAGAQADRRKALALAPESARTQGGLARLLITFGQLPEAIEAAKRATEVDPLLSATWLLLAEALTDAGQFTAAHEALARALEISPDSYYVRYCLGFLQLLESKPSDASATFRTVEEEVFRLTGMSMAEHSLGHPAQSQQALRELIDRHAGDSAYQVAQVYAWRSEKDRAFEWLDRAYRQRDSGLVYVKVDPALASLHADPRFAAFLRKMKLPE